MKLRLTIISIALAAVAFAFKQDKNVDIKKSINDNGKTMRVKVYIKRYGKKTTYDKTFNTKGWDKTQKDALVNRISDSLGIGK